MSQTRTVINRGKRTFTLKPGTDGAPRILEPGKSIECLDEPEFKHLTRYLDVVDAEKAVPGMANRHADLEKKLAEAQAENERLKAAKVEKSPEPEPKPEHHHPEPKAKSHKRKTR